MTLEDAPPIIEQLQKDCLQYDYPCRPTFQEIYNRLETYLKTAEKSELEWKEPSQEPKRRNMEGNGPLPALDKSDEEYKQ